MGVRKCYVTDCKSDARRAEDAGVTFHKVPLLPVRRAKWRTLCRNEDDSNFRLACSRHFLRSDFIAYASGKYVLRRDAFPSIFPWTDDVWKQIKHVKKEKEKEEKIKYEEIKKEPDPILNTKRSRKKKVIPDYVQGDDLKYKKNTTSKDKDKIEADKTLALEERLYAETPPVLEPEAMKVEPLSDVECDNIPNLEPSETVPKPIVTKQSKSGKTLKKLKKSDDIDKSVKDSTKSVVKQKLKETVRKKMESSSINKSVSKPLNASIIKDRIIVEEKCSPTEIKAHEASCPKETKEEEEEEVSGVIKEELADANVSQDESLVSDIIEETAEAGENEMKEEDEELVEQAIKEEAKDDDEKEEMKKITNAAPIVFEPNTRIEALDFNQTWSSATILEVDYSENEVLVHFDSYSNKYDEWIGIHSSSIRAPGSGDTESMNVEEIKEEVNSVDDSTITEPNLKYSVGDRCFAYWVDTKKFPASIKEVVDDDTYVVEFDDGYIKTLDSSKIIRVTKNCPVPSKSTKEDRRNKKRKINVKNLFKMSSKKEVKTEDTELTPWLPKFSKGKPVGTPTKIMTKFGLRDSVIVPDPNLPPGWEKHVTPRPDQRSKYTCIIITDTGKRLRSSNDVQRYKQDNPDFPADKYRFDFHLSWKRKSTGTSASTPSSTTAVASTSNSTESSSRPQTPAPPPPRSDALKIVQVNGGYQCPIDGCDKSFRRENLVQMHVKHYHPEFAKFLTSTPNVIDLIYQRLHGEEYEHTPSRYDAASIRNTRRNSNINAPDDCTTPSAIADKAERSEKSIDQKDAEIKKLLNAAPFDGGLSSDSCSTPIASGSGSSNDSLSRADNSADMGPDLKALIVTTKSGLKTIPPVKKEVKLEEVSSDTKDNKDYGRKRKFEDDEATSSTILSEGELSIPPTGIPSAKTGSLDHIIGEDGKMIKLEHMRKEEIVNCTCGITEEDGLMIQCEVCMCWQHAHCNNYVCEDDIPSKYVCYICLNPYGQRSSMKYAYDQEWLKHGQLPTAGYHCTDADVNEKRFNDLKTSHDISGGLLELKEYMHTLMLKTKVAESKNHQKLYLWSKPWPKRDLNDDGSQLEDSKSDADIDQPTETPNYRSNVPEPEAPIKAEDCRNNLLDHIEHCQTLIEQRLAEFEARIDALDSEPFDEAEIGRMRMTTTMLVRDMRTLKEISEMAG